MAQGAAQESAPDSSYLNPQSRQRALAAMSDDTLDILVIGGGITGAGIALDAATRGLRTGLVEAGDYASGTSAYSSKLIHGGLRYLLNLDFHLVAEALKERGLLLGTIAPHLVKAQPFLWPLRMPVIERAYSAVGIGMYDALAWAGAHGHRTVPAQRHHSKAGTLRIFPAIRPDHLSGSIEFYDARVDDARLVIDVIRTAQAHGALVANRAQVTELIRSPAGSTQNGSVPADNTPTGSTSATTPRVTGAIVTDLETGTRHTVRATHIINATGVWTEETQALAATAAPPTTGLRRSGSGPTDSSPTALPTATGLRVQASKGVHIVIPRNRIQAQAGIFLRTEKSVLFIIPWQRYWIIGTTDTPYASDLTKPVATSADIDYILDHANSILATTLTRADIIGTYAGLRPLLQPHQAGPGETAKVSREHTVAQVAPGMSAIAGGKLTTYRVMAKDAVDFAIGPATKTRPSVTDTVPLVGATGYQDARARAADIAATHGFGAARVDSLLDRYGAEIDTVLELIAARPDLGRPLANAPQFLRAEVVFAARYEGAAHVEDVLIRRVRLDLEQRDRGASSALEVADLLAAELGWDTATQAREVATYAERVRQLAAAEALPTDDQAARAVTDSQDIVPRLAPPVSSTKGPQ